MTIFGDRSVVTYYVYFKYLTCLVVHVFEGDACGVFNAGSGISYSISNVVDGVGKGTSYIFEKRNLASRAFGMDRIFRN
jgi:hypothetical protein